MDEEKRESRVDINELLNKYISDSETSDAAESAKRPRRRMAAKRSPELIDEERPSASYQDDADAAGTYHDDTADTADADDIVDTADTADIADTDDAENAGTDQDAVWQSEASEADAGDNAYTDVPADDGEASDEESEVTGSGFTQMSDYVHEDAAGYTGAVEDGTAAADSDADDADADDAADAGDDTDDTKVFEQYMNDDAPSYDGIMGAETEPASDSGVEDAGVDADADSGDGTSADDQNAAQLFTDEDGEIDEFDMNILLGLGLDDELEQTVGTEKVTKFVEKQQDDLHKIVTVNRERASLEYEYMNKTQTKEVADMYVGSYRRAKIKLALSVVLTVVLLLFECHATFGITLGGALSPTMYPVVYIMAGLQLVLLVAAPAWKSICFGIRDFFRGKPTAASIAGFSLIFNVVYNITLAAFNAFNEVTPETFNLPVACTFVMLYVCELINIRGQITSFGIVSSGKKKYALSSLSMADSHLEHEAFSDLMEEDDKAEDISVLKVEAADFVGDYFLRTNRNPGGRKFIGFLVPIVVIIAAAFFAYKFNGGTVYDGARAAISVALMCLPASVFYMFSHPFYRAVSRAAEDDCTIIGEGSVEEYADAAIISFDDLSVFPSMGVNVRGINVFGNHRIDRVLYTAASVFCTVGGPLADVFDLATREIGHSDDVTVERCLPGLLEVTADGSNVMFGSIDAIESVGVRIPKPLLDHRDDDFGDNVSIMYMVENGKFIARMLIQYIVDADFEFILKQLDRSGMFVGIKTFDPNVTEAFIGRQVQLKDYPVRVIRCKSLEDKTQLTDTTISGLISTDSPKSLLQTVTLCERVLHARSINTMLAVISLFVSLLVAALSLIFSALTITPLFVTLYQLFWIIPMFVISRMIVS